MCRCVVVVTHVPLVEQALLVVQERPTLSVMDLFAGVGINLANVPRQAWDNLFMTKPQERLDDFDDWAVLCQFLSKAKEVFSASSGLEHAGSRSPGPAGSKDTILPRLSMLYLTSFPGSGKSHFCRLLAEAADKVRAGDKRAVAHLREAASRASDLPRPSGWMSSPVFTEATVKWLGELVVLGLNFNSERWQLVESGGDGELARFSGGKFIPLHLRILFFAAADLSDAGAADEQWQRLVTKCSQAVKAGILTPAVLRAAVKDLLRRRCSEPTLQRPFLLVIDELGKCDSFCPEVYKKDDKHPDASSAFRSEACELANVVNGRVLMPSLDVLLPHGETTASKRLAVEAVLLPPFPVAQLLQQTLRRLSLDHGLHLNKDGTLVKAAADGDDLVGARAASLAAIVGSDARFAIYLHAQLKAAVAGDSLAALLTRAAETGGLTYTEVWLYPWAEVVLAHALFGLRVKATGLAGFAARRGSSPGPTWDSIRRKGLIQARGGASFDVQLPVYVLWALDDPSVDGSPLLRALKNMKTPPGETTPQWQSWEVIWANLEVALPHARSLVASPASVEGMSVMYPSTSHFGHLARAVRFDATNLPAAVDQRLLAALMHRYLLDDVLLMQCVWRTEVNAAAVDAVRFVVDENGKMWVRCQQAKHSAVNESLTWGSVCAVVKSMQVWLATAVVLAACCDPADHVFGGVACARRVAGVWKGERGNMDKNIPSEVAKKNMEQAKQQAESALAVMSKTVTTPDDLAEVESFVEAMWSMLPPTSASVKDVVRAVSTVLGRAIYVVAAHRSRGRNFCSDRRNAPSALMDRAIVLTRDDLPGHVGPFLSSLVNDCGLTDGSTFSAESPAPPSSSLTPSASLSVSAS